MGALIFKRDNWTGGTVTCLLELRASVENVIFIGGCLAPLSVTFNFYKGRKLFLLKGQRPVVPIVSLKRASPNLLDRH